jgi:hypothetical protein
MINKIVLTISALLFSFSAATLPNYVQTVPQGGDIIAALEALPGGDSTHAGTGTVIITSDATGTPWLMGPGDPNWNNPQAGWLKLTGPITIDCVGAYIAPPHGHKNGCGLHGSIWISAASKNIDIRNLMFMDYLGWYIRYGIDSNGNRNGSGGSSSFSLENVGWNHGGCNGTGPGMDIGSNSFWIWMSDIVASGCVKGIFPVTFASRKSGVVTVTTPVNNISSGNCVTLQNISDPSFNGSVQVTALDATHFTFPSSGPDAAASGGQVVTASAAAINIDPGSGSGSGLVFIKNINLNNGGIRFAPGANGGGVYAENISYEGNFTDPDMPPVLVTKIVDPTIVRIDHLEVADPMVSVRSVAVDNWLARSPNSVTLDGVPVGNPMGNPGPDINRRGFSPIVAPSTNLATTDATKWGAVVVPAIDGPDFSSNAGRAVSPSGQQFIPFYLADWQSPEVGDTYIFGAWVRSVNANGYSNSTVPIKFGMNNDGLGNGDTCTNGTAGGQVLRPGDITSANGQWQWFSGFCKVLTSPSPAGFQFAGMVDPTHPTDFFGPVFIKIPAGTKSDAELWQITNNLNSFSPACKRAQLCSVSGPIGLVTLRKP